MSGDHNMNLYGDGTVFRGERSADSKGVTYTLHDLLNAKGVSEPLREAVKVLQRENAELREALEHPSYEEENRLRAEVDRMRAKIAEMERQEPTRDWWDCLIADISAIDCMYRGSPTYAHDAYWMRDRVVWMLEKRRDALPGAQGEKK